MTWSTNEIEYEGFPLLLRRPDHINIWQHKQKLTQLISVEHFLDSVTSNGLPEKNYNQSLTNFDYYMCTIFDKTTDGIIFLIETFAGKRNYYYYSAPGYNITKQIKAATNKFNVKLKVNVRSDDDWGFFDAYPIELFKR